MINNKNPNAGMFDWLKAQNKINKISNLETEKLLSENEKKQEKIKSYNLPTFKSTGTWPSLADALNNLSKSRWNSDKFYVRCVPADNNDQLKIQRIGNIDFADIEKFIDSLPGGKSRYMVEIREYWEPDFSGTIISDGQGRTVVEQVRGAHANLEKAQISDSQNNIINGIKNISLDQNNFDIHFNEQGILTEEEKNVMIKALNFFLPEFNRVSLEKLKIYAEYSYHKKYGYKFLDVADSDYWTKLK